MSSGPLYTPRRPQIDAHWFWGFAVGIAYERHSLFVMLGVFQIEVFW